MIIIVTNSFPFTPFSAAWWSIADDVPNDTHGWNAANWNNNNYYKNKLYIKLKILNKLFNNISIY
jgi:hypothetical protein